MSNYTVEAMCSWLGEGHLERVFKDIGRIATALETLAAPPKSDEEKFTDAMSTVEKILGDPLPGKDFSRFAPKLAKVAKLARKVRKVLT